MANDTPQTVRELALRYPETLEATSCNKAAFKARKKNFLFVGEKPTEWNVMLKLDDSYAEAETLAQSHPESYEPGKGGWTTLRFAPGESPPAGLLARWVDESYRLLAPKTLVKTLPEFGPPSGA